MDTALFNHEPVSIETDSLIAAIDTLIFPNDSLENKPVITDSLSNISKHSSKKLSPNAIESSVKYISQDSIIISLAEKKIVLFEDAKAYYEDIELNSAYMEFGFLNNELYASGIADSCGRIHAPPVFKQGNQEFCSQEISYNFKSGKAKVVKVITNEGEGYIHGHYVKHVDEKTSYIKGGQYTTCNLEHPHFQIRFGKAKVIQDEKIVTGPAYMSFGNIPTPLALPFGYFPLNKDRASGIIMPKYGDGANRGFYFEDFGYYFGINDNLDLSLLGYITTRGHWRAKAESNYVFRYKCNGVVKLSFGQNYFGERGTIEGYNTNDFRVYWKHNQDPKSHPTTRFSAQVDVLSSTYNKYNPATPQDYLSNQYTSSVNLATNIKSFFFFDAALSYMQNTRSKDINIGLPEVSMSVRQFYPFRKRIKVGKLKWYDNISMKWSSQAVNRINTQDTLFFQPETWREIQSGIQHTVPLNIPIKVGKQFNWNTNATFTEKWYLQRNDPNWMGALTGDSVYYLKKIDVFNRGFYALHDLSLSTSLTTKIYFMYSALKNPLSLRHVLSPDLSFTYRPYLSQDAYTYCEHPFTNESVEHYYFNGAIFGGVAAHNQAVARFTINNNLELKVRSKKDTITGTRKITLFDNIGVSCGYDFAADSLRWQPLSLSGRTTLFSFLNISFMFNFDPYIIDSTRRHYNQTELMVNQRLMRLSGSNLKVDLNWRINQDFFKGKKKNNKHLQETDAMGMPNYRPDFTNPWNVTINYTFTHSLGDNLLYYKILKDNTVKIYESKIVQTINLAVDMNITRKWKVEVMTGYDIQQKDFSYTKIKLHRDLHCWEMWFEWIPFGGQKSWTFHINVKASVLQDLMYELKKDPRDNYY